jgi:hypothetical protein
MCPGLTAIAQMRRTRDATVNADREPEFPLGDDNEVFPLRLEPRNRYITGGVGPWPLWWVGTGLVWSL